MTQHAVKVLIVDDSSVARMWLAQLLKADSNIQIIGEVETGQAAVDFVKETRPDVVLMDVHMPGMDGFEATRRIMETHPVPIVICSATSNPKDVATSFRLLEAGAVACVEKPGGPGHPNSEGLTVILRDTIKLMAEVKVVRRWSKARRLNAQAPRVIHSPAKIRIIGIGASTGGPPVLQALLKALPRDFPVPILIVQHISPGFLAGFTEWLSQSTVLQIRIATHGILPLPGCVYLAPDDFHMGIGSGGKIILSRAPAENGLRPSVSYLFRSLAGECPGSAIGVMLTGMGKDGAAELKLMKERGSVTLVQNRETSVVYGMPGAAVELAAATHVLPYDEIGQMLLKLVPVGNRIGEDERSERTQQ